MRHRRRQLRRVRRAEHRAECVAWAEIMAVVSAQNEYPDAHVCKFGPTRVRHGVAYVQLAAVRVGKVHDMSTSVRVRV